jgi:hypothetical protein
MLVILKNESPIVIVLYVAIYFFIGTVWSLIKWQLYLSKIAKKINIAIKNYDKSDRLSLKPFLLNKNLSVPELQENKSRISMWITFWPLSMLLSLMDDFIKRVANEIVEFLHKLYQSMIDKIFKNINITIEKDK